MNSTNFFFYKKMKIDKNLIKISNKYIIKDAYIFVNDYNLPLSYVSIKKKNNKKLEGKYVKFLDKNTLEIISKLNYIFKNDNRNYEYYYLILKIVKKYSWFNIVLHFLPDNYFSKKEYKILKVECFCDKNKYLTNLIV
jgi:hypothetical protein